MRIENGLYALAVDPRHGSIISLADKASGTELIAEPELAENFRLLLPLPDLEANYILSTGQGLSAAERTATGMELRWAAPLRNEQGEFDLPVTVRIDFVDTAIHFTISVENRTEHRLAEVWHAGLGGVLGLGDRESTETLFPAYHGGLGESLFRQFPENMGVGSGGGMRFPEYYVRYPGGLDMPWLSMYNPGLGRGLYCACHDPLPRLKLFRFELHPGLARNRLNGNWPSDEEIAAMRETYPPGVVMHCVHLPYTAPGAAFDSPPAVFRYHDGDWHDAARIYRDWFTSRWPVRASERNWLRRQQAVQDAMFLLPEGNLMMTFKDMVRWAGNAKECGVDTVMVSGWNVGGHDNQYPNYTPDPRLGTWEDLSDAVEACHEMDVKVLFFINIGPVDTSTDWYRDELHQYRVMTARGASSSYGWGMGTLGARMGCSQPPLTSCNPWFPEFRRVIVDQMRKLAEIGADGVHIDKIGGGVMDFNPALPLGPDQADFVGIIKCIEETIETCRQVHPHFAVSVESGWDLLLPYSDGWWNWHDTLDHIPATKYAFPEFMPIFAVVQPWDYNNVNNAVRYGYQILLGPVRFSASMGDEQYRDLAAYIREVIRLRAELADTIFFGDFLDQDGVDVQAPAQVRYNTHRSPETGRRACVLVNQSRGSADAVVTFDNSAQARVRIHRPFEDVVEGEAPAAVSIPGERLAIVVEV